MSGRTVHEISCLPLLKDPKLSRHLGRDRLPAFHSSNIPRFQGTRACSTAHEIPLETAATQAPVMNREPPPKNEPKGGPRSALAARNRVL